MITGILPAWVEPDPLRRAADALGLQRVADRLADRLIPGLSVLTTRARYFTFLAWAREQSGVTVNELDIHRCEVSLVFAEAIRSSKAPGHEQSCTFVGSRNVRKFAIDRIPQDPRSVYKVPAWRAYRASMVDLELIDGASSFSLTDLGHEAARAFRKAVRPRFAPRSPLPPRACLSLISSAESTRLRDVLGLSIRGRLDLGSPEGRVRRAAFAREVRALFRAGTLGPESVLPSYESRLGRTLEEPRETLRAAAVWERLSVGLNTLFILWVRSVNAGEPRRFESDLSQLLSRRAPPSRFKAAASPLGGILMTDASALAQGVASLRLGLRLNDRLRDIGVELPDPSAFELARILIGKGNTVKSRTPDALARLLGRHREAKGDESWVREGANGTLEMSRDAGEGWTIPKLVRPHAYRMRAFGSVARDLGGL